MQERELMFDDPADRREYYERWVEEHTRPTHPDTSMEAAQKMAPKVGSAMETALYCLRRVPNSTARELEERFGETDGALRKRLSDLRAKGLARVTGKRKCRITGMNAQTWAPVDSAD